MTKRKSVESTRTTEQMRQESAALAKRLKQVTWRVVAGPPGTPATLTTWEDPERFPGRGAS
jgi:hypothetical protein